MRLALVTCREECLTVPYAAGARKSRAQKKKARSMRQSVILMPVRRVEPAHFMAFLLDRVFVKNA
jgi:hypothetical protein